MKITTRKIGDLHETGQYIIREYDDFEYVNPINQIMTMYIGSMISFERELLIMNGFNTNSKILEDNLLKKAIKEWENEFNRYKSIKIPENLTNILKTEKKKEQINLLKGLSLTSDELIAFIFESYENFGYTYSQYKATHHHSGLDEKELPVFIHIEDNGKLNSIGNTKLTEGQQKQVIEHRNVIVSKFIDNGNKWHCFFLTYKSLGGREQYKNGQPHLHYISNTWNISRQNIKEQLTNKKYSLPSLPHIDFHTHRNPRRDK